MLSKYFFIFFSFFILVAQGHNWNYDGVNDWWEEFRHCGGKNQSPIDLSENVQNEIYPTPLAFQNQDSQNLLWIFKIQDHSAKIKVLGQEEDLSSITGGVLGNNTYRFEQMHFHWPSEHTIHGKHFNLELHIVHYNQHYGSFRNALGKDDGVAVITQFYQLSESHSDLKDLMKYMKLLILSDEYKTFGFRMDTLNLNFTEYLTYLGSLTTPPCTEKVQWIINSESKKITKEEMKTLEILLYTKFEEKSNNRPIQNLNHRVIYKIDNEYNHN